MSDPERVRDLELEMRLRIATKLEDVLRHEAESADITITDALVILGMTLGLAMAKAPNDAARRAGADAHRKGVVQAMQLADAVEMMTTVPKS